ncbi:DUF2004 domain-containing protein [Chitinophaga oryzae]|uniref:DUF2004 domain-containing protein n=1 Tax=Chitinophaga oryzae TaxID=2725414 RepID=A0AAE6ZEH1_9BACT|nr:DUF2004 domain-containing protein [Chitinophaga oryzae]QJB30122.1 DUF2004 domain-containing protein [Chitinophaga oryzae]QJB36620.1 DUF2004 domain-containing protein [Chitinophaga oryzae]
MQHPLPHFGEINREQLEEYYSITTTAGINLDLNFEHTRIDADNAAMLAEWLRDIDQLDVKNKAALQQDFETSEGETQKYFRFYIEELPEEQLADLVGEAETDEEKAAILLSKLQLCRVGFYPDGKYGTTSYAVFDYTIYIDGEPEDQLLVVNRDAQRELIDITWES